MVKIKREFRLKFSRPTTLLTPYVMRKPKARSLYYFNKMLSLKLFITYNKMSINMRISSDDLLILGKNGSASMPLRYNKDKSENPLLPRLLKC